MRKLITALAIVLGSLGLMGVTTQNPAGATGVPCSVGSGGWWIHGADLMQCIVDGNHYLVRQWGSGGTVDKGIVLNFWLPADLQFTILWGDSSGSAVAFCGTASSVTHSQLVRTGAPAGWERVFHFQKNGVWYDQGSLNHFDGWAGTQAYGGVYGPYNCSNFAWKWGSADYLSAG